MSERAVKTELMIAGYHNLVFVRQTAWKETIVILYPHNYKRFKITPSLRGAETEFFMNESNSFTTLKGY